jgi:aminopeptidase N
MPSLTQAEASARSALVDLTSYDVFLDLTADPPRSRSTVRFGCRQPGAATFADLVAGFAGGMLNGAAVEPPTGGRLALRDLAVENELTVAAEVAPGTLVRYEEFLLIAAYPSDAPGLFACFDQPDLVTDFTLTVQAPRGWELLSNGAVTEHAAGTWRFASVHGMRPYDFTVCGGPMTSSAPGLWCRPALSQSPGLLEFDAAARDGLRRYAQLLKVPQPFPKYDIVFFPDFFATALSVPGLMVVTETVLNGPADFATMIARHEVLHQWFGGLVGTRWWDDLWLDEALATYVSYPEPDDWISFTYRDTERAYLADSLPGTPPVSSPVQTVAQALDRPPAITYTKGAAAIRQLAALIGQDALLRGLTDYLTRHRGAAGLDDLIACWSRSAGRDLTGWATEWLRTSGISTLSLDGSAIVQENPRTHHLSIGLYDRDGSGLRRRQVVTAEVSGPRTEIGGLAADAIVLNEGAKAFARIRVDEGTFRALSEVAMNVGDPLTEAACWSTVWQMVTDAQLSAMDFAGLVTRRLAADPPLPLPGLDVLLDRAGTAARRWAPLDRRAGLRELLADAASRPVADPQVRLCMAAGMAGCAESEEQLDLVASWLRESWTDAGLRWKLASALAARGRISAEQIAALAEADPASGETQALSCLAMRPGTALKEAAWSASLAAAREGRWRLAVAHAHGFWVDGQEEELRGFRARYYAQVLPFVISCQDGDPRWAQMARRLADLLFPSVLAEPETLEPLAGLDVGEPLRYTLSVRECELRAVMAARATFS